MLGAVALLVLAFYPNNASAWESKYAYCRNGILTYYSDAEKNRIPDYSYAGYKYGESSIPIVREVASLTPVAGDNTARIQQALDKVGARAPDANGIRGALVLGPGVYQIDGTVNINKSGVVLRGSGDGADALANTILTAPGDSPHQRTVVVLGSGNSRWKTTRVRSDITTPFVQVGSKSFEVQSAAAFAVGDEIIVHHPSSQAWIDAVDGGGVRPDKPWRPGQMDIPFLRHITAISGTSLTLDVPVYNHLNRDLTQSYIAKAVWTPVILSGVENLRIDIQTDPDNPKDENHAKNGVSVVGARDCWVQKVTALHFVYAAVRTEGAFCVTVDSCQGLKPVGIRTGGRFYNFCADRRSQCVLFTKCHATGARHGYVSNGTSSVSGLVFFRCTSNGGTDMEAGHRWWTQGVLFDNMFEERRGSLRLINRGDWGTQHGWGSVHSVAWNFNRGMLIQKPPTAQNYGISSKGSFPTHFPKAGPQGVTEQKSGELVPASLYEAQLAERSFLSGTTVHLKDVARLLGRGKLGQALARAEVHLDSSGQGKAPDKAREARRVVDFLTEHLASRRREIAEMKAHDPVMALEQLVKLADVYSGSGHSKELKSEAAKWKKEPKVANELRARAALARIELPVENLRKKLAGRKASEQDMLRRYGNEIVALRNYIAMMRKRYPDTASARRAVAIAGELGIPLPRR